MLFWVFGIIDFLIILFSKTMFNNSFNLLQIFIHMFGILQLLAYKRDAGNVSQFFILLWTTEGISFVVEFLSYLNASSNYRRSGGSKSSMTVSK